MLPTCKQLYYAFTFTLIIQEILIKIKYVYRPDYVFIAQYMFWYVGPRLCVGLMVQNSS